MLNACKVTPYDLRSCVMTPLAGPTDMGQAMLLRKITNPMPLILKAEVLEHPCLLRVAFACPMQQVFSKPLLSHQPTSSCVSHASASKSVKANLKQGQLETFTITMNACIPRGHLSCRKLRSPETVQPEVFS